MNREFSNIYEGLNSAQSQAVEQFEGPSLIVAGAGSGKTRVLTCRIANILNHGHKAGSVLALLEVLLREICGWELFTQYLFVF